MMLAHALNIALCSDRGLLRANNEDAVFADPALGLAILADGMGGYQAGEVASDMAIRRLAEDFGGYVRSCLAAASGEAPDVEAMAQQLVGEIVATNSAIFNLALSLPEYAGMGTTLVLAWFYNNRMLVAHVGDSRLYRLRDGRLEQLTRDHSLIQEQLDSGMIDPDEALHAECRGLLTRALGAEPRVAVDVADHAVLPGDLILLCSDGLNEMLDDHAIGELLGAGGDNLPKLAEDLVRQANDRGGRDNVSVIVVQVEGDFAIPKNWWQRLKAHLG